MPETNVHPLPDELSFEDRRRLPARLRDRLPDARRPGHGLQEGEWVLLWGIGSGVATAALAIAKALGAHTIVTSSSDEKLARARELGADAAVNHATEDVVAARQGADRRRRARRRRARRRGDLVALARRGPRRRPHRRLRRDDRAQPAGRAAPDLVEAALGARLVDGHRKPTSRAPTTCRERARAAGRSTRSSRSPRRRPRTSGSSRASSSARCCSGSRSESAADGARLRAHRAAAEARRRGAARGQDRDRGARGGPRAAHGRAASAGRRPLDARSTSTTSRSR